MVMDLVILNMRSHRDFLPFVPRT